MMMDEELKYYLWILITCLNSSSSKFWKLIFPASINGWMAFPAFYEILGADASLLPI